MSPLSPSARLMATEGESVRDEFVRLGHPVFPVHGKRSYPRGTSWQKIASADAHEVIAEFSGLPEYIGYGVVTGAGLAVVDLDLVPPGDVYTGTYDEVDQSIRARLPETLRVKSRRGFHLYYRANARVSNRAHLFDGIVDVRGDGGYVIGPGSPWALDEWTPDPEHSYEVELDVAMADAPEWVYASPDQGNVQSDLIGEPVDTVPWIVQLEMERDAAKGDRSERFYALVGACRDAGLTVGQALTVAQSHSPSLQKYGRHLPREVSRAYGKVEPKPTHVQSPVIQGPRSGALEVPHDLPLWGLPLHVQEVINNAADIFQVPQSMATIATLGALSASLNGAVFVDSTAKRGNLVVLYVLGVAAPGDSKSSLLRAVFAGFNDATETRYSRDVIDLYARELTVVKRRAAKAIRDGSDEEVLEAEALVQEAERKLDAARRKPILTDTTPEGLAVELAGIRHVALVDAESSTFEAMLGLYSNGKPNLSLACAAHDGDRYVATRITRDAPPVESARLTWTNLIQPHVARTLALSRDFLAKGLFARYLIVWPDSLVGFRDMLAPRSTEALSEWREWLRVQSELWFDRGDVTVALSPGADALWREYRQAIENDTVPGSDPQSEGLAAWLSRAAEHAMRLAAIAALSEDPNAKEVREEHMRWGTEFLDALWPHALRLIRGEVVLKSPDGDNAWLFEVLKEHGPLKIGQIKKHVSVNKRALVQSALDALEFDGAIKSTAVGARGALEYEVSGV